MSENKLSETFAKILIGKSIVSGLKPEPDYEYKKCFECGYDQRVPLTRMETVHCHKCGKNLDTQVKPPKPPKKTNLSRVHAKGLLLNLFIFIGGIMAFFNGNIVFSILSLIFVCIFGLILLGNFQKGEKNMIRDLNESGKYFIADENEKVTINSLLYEIGRSLFFIILFFSSLIGLIFLLFEFTM